MAHLYGDDPVDRDGDRLERHRVAEQLARAICNVSEQSRSAVVGLVGPWGSGKTSVLGDIESSLRSSGWYVAHHNPWAYSDYEGAIAGFFTALREAVPDHVLGKEWRAAIGAWVSRMAPLGSAGGLAGVDATGAVGVVGRLISGDRTPTSLRDAAVAGLNKLEHPVLIVLDDLDRLEPQELLYTFKLVRLIGRLPNVYYLLAYDEDTLTDVLCRTDLVGAAPGRAQQYLEKVVQVRLEVPPMLSEQQASLVNEGIDDLCARFQIELSPDAVTRLQQAWVGCLSLYLDQPRAIKRLFTQIDALWPEVHGEVDFVDFILITFLRTFERRAFELIIRSRDELLQTPTSFGTSRGEESNADRWARWHGLLENADVRHPQGVALLLAELFLPLRSARENMTYGSSFFEDVRRRYGVGSEEYFDRYVQVGVPASDIPEALVSAAVAELRADDPGAAVESIQEWLRRDAAKVVRKLVRRDETAPLPATATLNLIADFYVSSADQKSGFLGLSPDWGMLRLAVAVVDRMDPESAGRTIEQIAHRGESGLALAGDLVRQGGLADEEGVERPWVSFAAPAVAQALRTALQLSATQPLERSPLVVRLLADLLHLEGEESTREFVWSLLEEGSWKLEELLGAMVPVGSSSDGRSTWESMGEFSEGTVEAFLGVDRVLERLQPLVELSDDLGTSFGRRRAGVDLTTRTQYALESMERIRRARGSSAENSTSGEADPAS